MKVFLDGNQCMFPDSSLVQPKFTLRRLNEQGKFATSFTGNLTFTGVDYSYLYSKLVTDPNAINQYVVLKFIDDCCNDQEYDFLIKPESLQWCEYPNKPSCELTANAVEYSADAIAYNCVESTLIWAGIGGNPSDNSFKNALHPRVKYCLDYASPMQDIIMILGCATLSMVGAFIPVLLTIASVIGTINGVIGVVNSLSGGSIGTIGGLGAMPDVLNWFNNLFNEFGALVAGCGYEHPSPYVRSYINNVCGLCGITFQSSILNDPTNDYWNLVYFSAPIKSGRIDLPYVTKPLVSFIEDNEPIHNGSSFMNELVQPFNAGWDIVDGVLRMERVDFFWSQFLWLDCTTYDPTLLISQCYEWAKKPRAAYADIEYQKDPVDWCGSMHTNEWSARTVEWNSPPNPIQKGVFEKTFPYSTARFRNDGYERDALSDYSWMPFGIGTAIKDNDNAMIMNAGTSFTPKLLILDNPVDLENSTVKFDWAGSTITNDGITPKRAYNYPMWVSTQSTGNLYDRFWQIENPRNASFSGYDFTVTLIWTCELLASLKISGSIKTSKGLSKTIDSIELDFSTNTMIIKGTV